MVLPAVTYYLTLIEIAVSFVYGSLQSPQL